MKQAGTGPSRRHIQGSKIAKGFPSVNLQYSKIEKAKNGLSGAPGGHFQNLDPLEKKQIFEKKSPNAEKQKEGLFGIFKHPFCCKISKKLKGDPLERNNRKKVSQCRKTERGDPLGFFNIHSVAKQQKKLKVVPLGKKF